MINIIDILIIMQQTLPCLGVYFRLPIIYFHPPVALILEWHPVIRISGDTCLPGIVELAVLV